MLKLKQSGELNPIEPKRAEKYKNLEVEVNRVFDALVLLDF